MMLVSPDLKARYVAAALKAVEVEMQKPGVDLKALTALIASVARVAHELASETVGQPPLRPPAADGSNVIAFRR